MNVQTRFSDKLEWVEHHGRLVLRKAAIDPKTRTVTIFKNAIRANYPKDYEARLAGTIEAARARALGDGNWDEDEHPRDEDGKFTVSGGGSTDQNDGAAAAVVGANEPVLHPETIDVTGDEWNKQTAIRLEKEYQTVKPDLEALIHKNVGEEVDTAVDEDDLHDNAPVVPDSWEMLSDDQQEEVKTKWMESTYQNFYDNEVENWSQNDEGGAIRDAFYEVANGDDDWARETLIENYTFNGQDLDPNNKGEDAVEKIPLKFSIDEVMGSLAFEVNDGDKGSNYRPYLDVRFSDEKLDAANPEGFDRDQQTLPGIEPLTASELLTEEQRKLITTDLQNAGNDLAQEKVDKGEIEPPDYLSDSVKEYQDEFWDQKDDSDKFGFAQNDTDIINEAQQAYDEYIESNGTSGGSDQVAIPDTFDPLQTEGGSDYKKTHALVTFMSRQRAFDLLKQRGLIEQGVDVSGYRQDIASIDNQLWSDWKASSAGSFGGQILQLASHEELGARYREMPTAREALIKQADDRYKEIGGFNGIKAMVRAKWETSQYALDKAGIHSLAVYRGLKVQMPDDEPVEEVAADHWTDPSNPTVSGHSNYERFSNARISRNGAYSTTTNREVANGWSAGSGTKVVLRIDAPRTAVLSFPAYGINVHAEKEVVLAGTAFRNWDAWKHNAPSVDSVPIQKGKAA